MRSNIAAVVLGSVMLTSGCAAFKANNLPVIEDAQYIVEAQEKIKVYSKWELESDSSFANDQAKVAAGAVHKDLFEKAIINSGCCDIVESKNEADLVVTGTAFNENNPAAVIPAVITGLSLYTIPSWVTATVHIQVDAAAGDKEGAYDLTDSMTMVQWLPMLFALPFTGSPIEAGKELDANVYKNLVVRMKDDGLLEK